MLMIIDTWLVYAGSPSSFSARNEQSIAGRALRALNENKKSRRDAGARSAAHGRLLRSVGAQGAAWGWTFGGNLVGGCPAGRVRSAIEATACRSDAASRGMLAASFREAGFAGGVHVLKRTPRILSTAPSASSLADGCTGLSCLT